MGLQTPPVIPPSGTLQHIFKHQFDFQCIFFAIFNTCVRFWCHFIKSQAFVLLGAAI